MYNHGDGMYFWITMPPSTDAIHAPSFCVGLAAMLTMAGPGHRPARPHPNPNRTPPSISLSSIFLFLGMLNSLVHAGAFFLEAIAKPGTASAIAPPITSIKLGSKLARVADRNPDTFAARRMPLTVRPRPKVNPASASATVSRSLWNLRV
jgi:hypothetical protein